MARISMLCLFYVSSSVREKCCMHFDVYLQYQAESKKKDLEITEKELTAEERLVKFTAEAGSGMKCEFCGNEIRPFPTLDDQKGMLYLPSYKMILFYN